LSSLRVIYVLPQAITRIWSLFGEMKFRILLESQLHCLHLVFNDPSYTYIKTLAAIVKNRISYPTMILEVTKGSYQGSAWDGMGRKKSSHGIDILQTIPWDGTLFKNLSSHPMGYYEKKFSSRGMGQFPKISRPIPSHPMK
jgi:hypothetical protein